MSFIKVPTSLSRHAASARKFANAGAWFFVAFSLVSVAWALAQQWADPQGFTTLYSATTGTLGTETAHNAIGLSYDGIPGLLLALVQTAGVGLAVVMSLLRRDRLRRIGHRVLIAWSALWTANLLWLATIDFDVASFGQVALMSALFGCTVYRANCRGTSPAVGIERETPPDDTPVVLAPDGATTPDDSAGPPLPRSLRQRLDDARAKHVSATALRRHARDAARRTRPALDAARQSVRRMIARLRSGWSTTGRPLRNSADA